MPNGYASPEYESVTASRYSIAAGTTPGREHALDRRDAGVGVAVEADHGQLELGSGHELQPRCGDEAERSLGADEQALQVVARDVLADRTADSDDLAGRDHGLDARSPSCR